MEGEGRGAILWQCSGVCYSINIYVKIPSLRSGWVKMGKRFFDFTVALVLLVIFSPLFLIVSFLIKITSPGPVFYRVKRMGKAVYPFSVYLFRTERVPTERIYSLFALKPHSGLTGIGRRLKEMNIEGLPRLINVLKGELSLVGPEPPSLEIAESYQKEYQLILQAKPGMVDLALLEEKRQSARLLKSEDPDKLYREEILPGKFSLSKLYVQCQSASLDLKILVKMISYYLLSFPFPFSKGDFGRPKPFVEVVAKYRRGIIFAIHIGAIVASNYAAFLLRFDGNIPRQYFISFLRVLPIVLAFRLISFHYYGLNRGFWRYAGIQDLINLGAATLVSSVAIWGAVTIFPVTDSYPRSVFLIDGYLLLMGLAFLRVFKRALSILTITSAGARRVMIIGAGNAGEMIARDMRQNPSYNRQPVAFIDDDPRKRNLKIHNIPVIGNLQDLEAAVEKCQPDEILIAIPSAAKVEMRRLVNRCKTMGLPIRRLPDLSAVLGAHHVSVTDIKTLEIEDLIGRPEMDIQNPDVANKISGKRVLVTGAGGSIGSELCRQVAMFKPEEIILFEISENNLHGIQIDLQERFPDIPLKPVLGDILDRRKLDQVFSSERPQIVFHAAAYKHVPMMEANPISSVRNNILGSYYVMMSAERHHSEDFVLISTDKAVYPSSVMGATKRVAEMLVKYYSGKIRLKAVSVRFGNVLESNGSVVPIFREQIRKGGPVKVTHPDVKRYFITIQEAVQLVLQAAVLGRGGEIFVLDMGEPIKIFDLAKTMIILSGFSPEKDIPIQIVGLRPGEKLEEELFERTEDVVKTVYEKIRLARNGLVTQDLLSYIEKFEAMDPQADPREIKSKLNELVPTYKIC